ncbi:MAG: ABC transporter permease [Planctomycetaceae bacterium]|nr:ABC transporter permease [Planctomycetaceae bacterium]
MTDDVSRPWWSGITVLLVLVLIVVGLRFLLGRTVEDGGATVIQFGFPAEVIVDLRISAILSGFIAGAALGLSGLAFQVLLRNPLASPWVLGVSSGAGFGILLASWMAGLGGVWAAVGAWALWGAGLPAAAAGAIVAILVVGGVARRLGGFDPVGLVLCGVIVGAVFGAATMLVQHLVPNGVRGDIVAWMMGRIPELSPGWMLWSGAVIVGGIGVVGWVLGRPLDAACLTEDEARSVGVPIDGLRRGLFLTGGLLAAVAVCMVGPIAFVGLLSPHAARLMVGARHRLLVPASFLAGGGVLVFADAVRQLIDLGGGRLPVGVVTAMVGGPIFLFLLLRGRAGS